MRTTANICKTKEVLSRIKEIEGLRYDTDIAAFLHVEKNRIGTWKERGTVPYERLVNYSLASGVSLDWLLNGLGPQRVATNKDTDRPAIDADLFVDLGKAVSQTLEEAGANLEIKKRDRLMAIVYNDIANEAEHNISSAKVKELTKLAA